MDTQELSFLYKSYINPKKACIYLNLYSGVTIQIEIVFSFTLPIIQSAFYNICQWKHKLNINR